ncbi:hypothetical protein [Alteribacillus sp. HJP-4]|uniref:hypothetical protein n=1 Tax=Alteribacillus sp. HJP-4 TaxID=2775394 RepID=UPI0035CD026F
MTKKAIFILGICFMFFMQPHLVDASSFWPFQPQKEPEEIDEETFEERWTDAQNEVEEADEEIRSEEERLADVNQSFQELENDSHSLFLEETRQDSSFQSTWDKFGMTFGAMREMRAQLWNSKNITVESPDASISDKFSIPDNHLENSELSDTGQTENDWENFDKQWEDFDKEWEDTFNQQDENQMEN